MQYNSLFKSSSNIIGIENNYKNSSPRIREMETIEHLYEGEGFHYFINKFIDLKTSDLTIEELKPMYTDRNFMFILISKIVSFCPSLQAINQRTQRQYDLKEKMLKKNNWLNLSEEIYSNFEKKGDNFIYINFDEEQDEDGDYIPNLNLLKPECMKHIEVDNNNKPIMYYYREYRDNIKVNYMNGDISTSNSGKYISMMFFRGFTLVIDPDNLKETTTINNQEISYTEKILNKSSYINEFAVIHIPSYKRQGDLFSKIPASYYVDDVITASKCTTNINQVNSQLGFPLKYLIDGTIVAGKLQPGSHILCKTDKVDENKQPILSPIPMKILQFEITNNLSTLVTEFNDLVDTLYEKAGLIPPSLEMKLGSTDSSRVIQQLRSQQENKVDLYVSQIINASYLLFRILFEENGEYDRNLDKNITFIKPDFILKSSPFDEQLFNQTQLNSKISELEDILRKMNVSEDKIKERTENTEITEETKVNKEVQNIVKNSSNVARTIPKEMEDSTK